ncbi:hypothetical protein SARC_14063, partial [Sphaeroforma arctica JP610]
GAPVSEPRSLRRTSAESVVPAPSDTPDRTLSPSISATGQATNPRSPKPVVRVTSPVAHPATAKHKNTCSADSTTATHGTAQPVLTEAGSDSPGARGRVTAQCDGQPADGRCTTLQDEIYSTAAAGGSAAGAGTSMRCDSTHSSPGMRSRNSPGGSTHSSLGVRGRTCPNSQGPGVVPKVRKKPQQPRLRAQSFHGSPDRDLDYADLYDTRRASPGHTHCTVAVDGLRVGRSPDRGQNRSQGMGGGASVSPSAKPATGTITEAPVLTQNGRTAPVPVSVTRSMEDRRRKKAFSVSGREACSEESSDLVPDFLKVRAGIDLASMLKMTPPCERRISSITKGLQSRSSFTSASSTDSHCDTGANTGANSGSGVNLENDPTKLTVAYPSSPNPTDGFVFSPSTKEQRGSTAAKGSV